MKVRNVLLVAVSAMLLVIWALACVAEESESEEIKPVLLVIDVQNIWMPMMAEEDVASAPQKINESIALFRELGYPIIAVYHTDPERGPEPGTEPFEFDDSIAITDVDQKVIKNYPSSFVKTDLEEMLRENDRNVVFLCGLSATGCVLATYFGAMEREFTTLMVADALISPDAEHTKTVADICYSMTLEKVRETLEEPLQE
jgi:nicotinamidase-related amidase